MDIYEYEEPDYQRIKREYENAVDYKLLEWALPYFNGTKKPNGKDFYTICTIPVKAAIDIERLTGREVYNFQQVIKCNEVVHIAKRHGKKGKADHSMEDIHDLARIKYIIDNYDEILDTGDFSKGQRNKEHRHAECLVFVKRINGYVITAQAITDSKKKNTLYIQSMYKVKTSAFFQEKERWKKQVEQKIAQKREWAVDSQSSRRNVQDAATPHTSILPQNGKNVNNFYENSSEQKNDTKKEVNGRWLKPSTHVQDEFTPNISILPQSEENVNNFMKNFSNLQTTNKSKNNDNDGFSM